MAAFKSSKTKKSFAWKKSIFIFLFFSALFAYISFTSKFFGKNSKITVVINKEDSIVISTFDKKEGSVTNLLVPGSTQVNVARQLGTWKLSSVWKLGENEKLTGILLSETIIKNFKIPVSAWADSPFYGISEGGPVAIFKGLLGYKTNLGMGDKIKLGLFSLGVSPGRRVAVDLSKQNFMKKTKLIGGEEGYLVSERFPQSLYTVFSDTEINNLNPRILIEDYAGGGGATGVLSQTLEVLGAKVTSIVKKEPGEFYCEISGESQYLVSRVIEIFGCAKAKAELESNFDLIIKVGEGFAKRY